MCVWGGVKVYLGGSGGVRTTVEGKLWSSGCRRRLERDGGGTVVLCVDCGDVLRRGCGVVASSTMELYGGCLL